MLLYICMLPYMSEQFRPGLALHLLPSSDTRTPFHIRYQLQGASQFGINRLEHMPTMYSTLDFHTFDARAKSHVPMMLRR